METHTEQLLRNDLFIDLVLTLRDDENQITHKFHKIILYMHSEYFRTLFTMFQEKTLKEVNLYVPNCYVSYDIIMSFYGLKTNQSNLPRWKYNIEYLKCCDFFGMPLDLDILNKIEIPPEAIDSLVNLANIIGPKEEIIGAISRILPDEYSDANIPEDIIQMLKPVNRLVSASVDGRICIWNPTSGDLIKTLEQGHKIGCICYSRDCKQIAYAGSDNCIRILDAETGSLVKILNGYIGLINMLRYYLYSNKNYIVISNICYSPDNKHIVSGRRNGSIEIWDVDTGILIKNITNADHMIFDIAYSPNGKYIASAGFHFRVWDAETGALIIDRNPYEVTLHLCYSPDGKKIAATDSWKTLKIYDIKSGEWESLSGCNRYNTYDACYSPDGKQIAVVESSGIKIWNTDTNTLLRHISYDWYDSRSHPKICYSADNKQILVHSDRGIDIWDVEKGIQIRTLRRHTKRISSMCYPSKTWMWNVQKKASTPTIHPKPTMGWLVYLQNIYYVVSSILLN